MGVIVVLLAIVAGLASAALTASYARLGVHRAAREDLGRAFDELERDEQELERARAGASPVQDESRHASLRERQFRRTATIDDVSGSVRVVALVPAVGTFSFFAVFAGAMLIASGPAASHDRGRLQATARVNLTNADLSGADLRRQVLLGKRFDNAQLPGANLSSAVADHASFRRADLSGALLRRAALRGADFSHADLRYAHLSGALLQGAVLRGADFSGADLSGADLRHADLRNARYDAATRWPSGFDPRAAGAVRANR